MRGAISEILWKAIFFILTIVGIVVLLSIITRVLSSFNVELLSLPAQQFSMGENLKIPPKSVVIYIPKGFFSEDDAYKLRTSVSKCLYGCICCLKFRDIISENKYAITFYGNRIEYDVDISGTKVNLPQDIVESYVGGNYFIILGDPKNLAKGEIGKLLNLNDAAYCLGLKRNITIYQDSYAGNYVVIIGNPNDHYINIPLKLVYEERDFMVISFG